MELSNGEIFQAVQSLKSIFDMELPVRTSLSLAKLIGKLDVSYQAIEKVRAGLVNKYGEQTEGTQQINVKPGSESFPKFLEEYNELMNQKTELVFDIVKLPQEVNGEALLLKPSLLVALQKFVEIEPLTVVK